MADIRINSLPSTASASSSDDFLALDGATNGTRKLNAFSPTFGGNLTVSGTGTSSVGGAFNIGANCYVPNANYYRGKNAAGSSDYRLIGVTSGNVVSIDPDAAGATFGGNLTASGTIRFDGQLLCGNAGGIQIRSAAGDANLVDVSGGRNLTMSGAATFGGNLQIGGAPNTSPSTIDRYSSVNVTNVADFPAFLLSVADGTKNVRGSMYIDASTTQEQWAWDFSYSSASYPQYKWKIAGTTLATLRDNGNLILSSTGTDSGNGKLQLADHSTSAGGIGFGTDVSLYRSGTSSLSVACNGTFVFAATDNGAADPQIQAAGGKGTRPGYSFTGDSNTGLFSSLADTLYFSTGGTTALTLDSSQNATFAGTVTPTGGIVGVTTNSNAAAGIVGQYVEAQVASGSAITLSTATAANITSISLTAGDWDVSSNCIFIPAGAPTLNLVAVGQTSSSATLPADVYRTQLSQPGNGFNSHLPVTTTRFSLASTTTIYLVAYAEFSGGTSLKAHGIISARRVR